MGGFFGVASKDDCVFDLFFGTDYHSHLGTRRAGMAVYGEDGFDRAIHNIENAPFRTKFDKDMQKMKGYYGIGCISDFEPQPLIVRSHHGTFAITTVGKINNAQEIVDEIFNDNNTHFLEMSGGDINPTELVAAIINQKENLIDGIHYALERIDGSLTLMILTPKGIYAARDKYGRTPLVIGHKEDAYCMAMESFSFQNLGYRPLKELGPGEIVIVNQEGIKTLMAPGSKMRICTFLWVYYGYPSSSYEGISVEQMRYNCGKNMAKRDHVKPDIVAGVPDSGIAHAIGYANQSGVPFARPFIKYTPTWPRSFMPTQQSQRNLIARMKLIPVHRLIKDKSLLMIDDSIVRGTQLRETTEFLYRNGAKEVHIRPACPPLLYGCKYLNFSRSKSEMDLITRRVIAKREGENVSDKVLADYADPNSTNYKEMLEEIRRISQLEGLTQPLEDYRQWLSDLQKIPAKEAEKARLLDTMQKLREESVLVWEQQKQEIQQKQEAKKAEIEAVQKTIWNHQENGKRFQNMQVDFNEQLVQKENEFRQQDREKYEPEFQEYLEGRQSRNYEYLMRERIKKKQPLEDAQEKAYEKLVEARSAYLRKYPNRTYSATIRDNDVYEKQLSNLECDNLEKYREEAQEQARAAVEHFKVDFVSKIRYAIKEAYQKKDELNRIISRLDFGKDKYQFVITKNKGPDGRFYRMFMDDALDINPSQLSDHMENQMNLFTMEHEEEYGDLMNELIEIFIPPENATREELEEARKNMDKYADYRTYLSFDMQQIVQGEKDMRIGLSKMIKKNSGGEGQNPLYIALLASFAQIYRINLSPKIKRPPTLRLVVLDEAFSKMDAEKVASCISLIRGLGFQAIISATNDKIQNYLENVDKTFVYANPNKKHISIQEFEKVEYDQLKVEE